MDVFVRERLPGHLEWTSRPVVLCGPSIVLWALLRTFDTYKAAIGWAWYSFGFFLPTLRDKGCDEALKLRQGLGNLELWERSRCMGQRRGLRGDGIVDIVWERIGGVLLGDKQVEETSYFLYFATAVFNISLVYAIIAINEAGEDPGALALSTYGMIKQSVLRLHSQVTTFPLHRVLSPAAKTAMGIILLTHREYRLSDFFLLAVAITYSFRTPITQFLDSITLPYRTLASPPKPQSCKHTPTCTCFHAHQKHLTHLTAKIEQQALLINESVARLNSSHQETTKLKALISSRDAELTLLTHKNTTLATHNLDLSTSHSTLRHSHRAHEAKIAELESALAHERSLAGKTTDRIWELEEEVAALEEDVKGKRRRIEELNGERVGLQGVVGGVEGGGCCGGGEGEEVGGGGGRGENERGGVEGGDGEEGGDGAGWGGAAVGGVWWGWSGRGRGFFWIGAC